MSWWWEGGQLDRQRCVSMVELLPSSQQDSCFSSSRGDLTLRPNSTWVALAILFIIRHLS